MSKEKSYHSFKDLAKAYYEQHPEIETQKLLKKYGLDYSLEDIENIEILEYDNRLIKILNKNTNEIIISDLYKKVHDKYSAKYSVGLITYNQDKDYYVEKYNYIKPAKTYEEAANNAIKSRNNPETLLLSRAYKDISTKYGDFCLAVEENYSNYKFGPHKIVSLYHGSHNDAIDDIYNDFGIEGCIFRWKYYFDTDFNQWMIGHSERLSAPFCNRWRYGITNCNNEEIDEPMYGSHVDRRYSFYSQFILNNKVKLKENPKYLLDYFNDNFYNRELLNVDEKTNVPRIYSGSYGDFISIIKEKAKIIIKYYNKKGGHELYETLNDYKSIAVDSETENDFTIEDFNNIINRINEEDMPLEFKDNLICELKTYINLHKRDDLNKINDFSLKDFTFDDMLRDLQQDNLSQVIEDMLESLSQTFNIDMNEMIGKSPIAQKKNKLIL